MADLNTSSGSLRGGKTTSRSMNPKIDMTPMVDLMFLLITFFMLTTTLAKPGSMLLSMPVDSDDPLPVSQDRTLTFCLGSNNKLQWYTGTVEKPSALETIGYSKGSIRKVLTKKQKDVLKKTGNNSGGLIAVIKPSDRSSYRNLVDLLDELKIASVDTYFIADITQPEIDRLKSEDIY